MDIKKWYQSMITRPSAKVIKQMIIDSSLKFEDINYDAVSQYLGEFLTMEEILEEELEEIVYIKKDTENKKIKKGGRTLNTKACGGDTRDVTMVNEDEQNQTHKNVNKEKALNTKACGGNDRNVHSKKDMEEKEDSLNTKACGGENSNVSTVSDDDGPNKAHKNVQRRI
jgi:hypothetical protein